MPQFQAQVPHPLRQDLPKLLAPRGMRTPSICGLLLVFRSSHALKPSLMQIEIYHLGRGKRCLWQGRVKQQALHLATCDADREPRS